MASSAALPLAPGVYRVPTLSDFINSYFFCESDGSVTLVDCGIKRAPKRIVAALASIGKAPQDVQRILLTHAHNDHSGGAAEVLAASSADGVSAHADDAGYLESGERPPLEASTTARLFSRLSSGRFSPVPVIEQIADGQLLDVAGGLRVHHTPGHTPGHVSLLHEPTAVLITGDAIFNMRGRMSWPVRAFCTNFALNEQSAGVLGELEYDVAAFTHGPPITDRAREAVRGFLGQADPTAARGA